MNRVADHSSSGGLKRRAILVRLVADPVAEIAEDVEEMVRSDDDRHSASIIVSPFA